LAIFNETHCSELPQSRIQKLLHNRGEFLRKIWIEAEKFFQNQSKNLLIRILLSMAFDVARVHAWPSVGVSSMALSTLGQQNFVVFSDVSVWGLGMNANEILGDGTTFFRSGLVPQRSEPHQGGLQTRCRHRTQNRSPPKTPRSHGEVLHAQTQRGRLEITTHL
jgi:hypothetical protein